MNILMKIPFPVIFASAFIMGVGLAEILLLRFLNREWWDKKYIRRAAWLLPIVGVIMVALWGIGAYRGISGLLYPGAIGVALTFILEVCLMLSLPFSGLLHLTNKLADRLSHRHRSADRDRIDSTRRSILKIAAISVPTVALAMGASGVGGAAAVAKVYRRTLKIENLPPGLDGLRILHLSDLHLAHYITLDDIALVLGEAVAYAPELILVTGDIADDLRLLPDVLSMIEEFGAPLGSYACLGNHEYHRGIRHVRRIFDNSTMPLLVNEGISIERGGSTISLGGLDDPRRIGGKDNEFYRNTIDRTIANSPAGDYAILMSHRPDALDYATEKGVGLILAGHTHGGQIGIMGRSLFESVWPDRYLWGHYHRGKSHLYTSSGVGHWFPFRLGCAPEAPVIELRRG